MAFGQYFDDEDPPVMGNDNPYPDYDIFGPANTGDIIGNTGPGLSFGELDRNYGTFFGTPTYGTPTPDDSFGPANTGDIIRNTGPGYGLDDRPSDPNSWYRRLGRGALDVLRNTRPGGGPPGQGQNSNVLPAIARALQGLLQGRAQGRISEAEMARLYDYLNLARTRTFYDRAGTELDQRKFAQDLQERSFRNATRGRYLQQLDPATSRIMAPPELRQFQGTGGTSIADIPQGTRDEIGGTMYRNAITELLDPLQPGTATSGRRMAELPVPEPISPTPEATGFDTALSWLSPILSGLYPTAQPTSTTPPKEEKKPPAEPPAAVPVYRSPNSTMPTAPGQQPYIGDVTTGAPGRAELSTTARSITPFGTDYASSPAGLNAGAGSTGLPPISNLVRDVPGPVSPLSPYDPWNRQRGRRA